MVRDALSLGGGRLAGADIHPAVDLEGVGGDDLGDQPAALELAGDLDGKGGLAAGGGADDDGDAGGGGIVGL